MKILILANNDIGLYKFRKELIQELLSLEDNKGISSQVFVSLPDGPFISRLEDMGCIFINTPIDRRGINPISDLKLLLHYRKIVKEIQPDVVLSYTIKPNIYGGITCSNARIPYIVNITGLGTAVENRGFLQVLTIELYRIALKNVTTIFFQNEQNEKFFERKKLGLGKHKILPGSGVNIKQYKPLPYPNDEIIEFLFVARIMKEKGIEQYIKAAQVIKKKYANVKFHVCGACEQDYIQQINELEEQGIIIYHGLVEDMSKVYEKVHCIVHPTYYPEGLSNVLLESAASARPIITTNRSGCKEVVDDGKSGFLIEERSSGDLIEKIEKFISMKWEEKKDMGIKGRKKIEKNFNRNIVIGKYLEEIKNIN
ncbi:MAG: glycosyltransferase family 4 protein [Enterococcus sp.]